MSETANNPEILPCPFCGEQPAIYEKKFHCVELQSQFFIECVECKRAAIKDGWFNINGAIYAWNTRHDRNSE